jgi:hypothetical protein
VVPTIHGDSRRLAHEPPIGQRLWPEGIDLEAWWRGLLQDQNRCLDVRRQVSRIPGRVENRGLHGAAPTDVVQDRRTTTRVPKEPDPIRVCAGQRTGRLHQRDQRLQGFGTGRRRHRRCVWAGDRSNETGAAARAATKPACGHRQDTTTREILSQAYVLVGEAVRAMQEHDGREGPRAARSRDCREHDAETRSRDCDPLHHEGLGTGWRFRLGDGYPRQRAEAALGCLCRGVLDGRDQRDEHAGRGEGSHEPQSCHSASPCGNLIAP